MNTRTISRRSNGSSTIEVTMSGGRCVKTAAHGKLGIQRADGA
ncbi:MAG TPA: hypothetical protein VK459_13140 [Polyangiaceae bacterium]|nr:hypothetical protein [Polyangiaceae bacterium]